MLAEKMKIRWGEMGIKGKTFEGEGMGMKAVGNGLGW